MSFKEILEFVVTNWSLILAALCIIVLGVQKIIEFISYPTEKKVAEIKSRLLEWVRAAEADLKGGTGAFKLSQVYDKFCEAFPYMKKWYSLEKFEVLVDEALSDMNELLSDEKVRANALKSE